MDPFSDARLDDVLRSHLKRLRDEIAALDTDYVLKASPAELEAHYVAKGTIAPLVFHADQRHIEDRQGVDVDVSSEYFMRDLRPGTRHAVRGTRLVVAVPYEGERDLWKYRPSAFTLSSYPSIEVLDDRIRLCVDFRDDSANAEQVKREIASAVDQLARASASIKQDVDRFNCDLLRELHTALEARRGRALQTSQVLEALDIPIHRAAAPAGYTLPVQRRKKPSSMPPIAAGPYRPEPRLSDEEYAHILKILHSMSLVIERNPSAFRTLDEETIRTHFLIHLNGHYEGGATGETFNAAGKTDILIREGDRNVFIAECKFWSGPKTFEEAVDQLLGYLSWRDSKCALLIFNRNKDSSAVVEKMRAIMLARPEFKKALGRTAEGHERYILVKTSDPGRELILTTMAFDVPTQDAEA